MSNHELIDFLLGELPDDRAAAWEERLRREPELAREAELYRRSIGILREAARGAAWAPARATGWRVALRIGVAAAALLLVAIGVFWMERGGPARDRVFEPDGVYGALWPEELGADGRTRPAPQADGYRVLRGAVSVGAIGARARHPLRPGDPVLEESELSCGNDEGACLALPHGGLLFLRPLSTVQLRARADHRAALRLLSGVAATVAGDEPIHLAIDGTDLLLTQAGGAALLRRQDADAICLRGRLDLHLVDGSTWRVEPGQRLPAACANAPESEPADVETIELDWYEALVGCAARRTTVRLDAGGRSPPLKAGAGALLYLALAPPSREAVDVVVRYGDGPGRTFRTSVGRGLEVRVPLASLGKGPVLRVTPANAVRQARLFEPR